MEKVTLHEPNKTKRKNIQRSKMRNILTIIFISLLILFHISDFIFYKDYVDNSCKLTKFFQKWSAMEGISNFFSDYLTYWIAGFFLLHVLYTKNLKYFLFLFSIWSFPIVFTIIQKAIWGRGRPFFICTPGEIEIWKCSCEFGMPSTHASMAVGVYFVLYTFIADLIDGKN